MAAELYYVQLLFDERVHGASDAGWVSVAVVANTPTAVDRALRRYSDSLHPTAGKPVAVRVVSEAEIRREGGERAVRRAAAGITAAALSFERAA